jgi:hypothetical protein
MQNDSQDLSVQAYEELLHTYVRFHSPVRLFPILESKENLWYFIGHTCSLIATRIAEQQSKDARKGRPNSAFLRGLSCLDKLIWDELWLFPDDMLVSRTARLLGIMLHTRGLPRKSKDIHDPRRVALEYEMLREKLKPFIPRRPTKVDTRRTHQYHRATFGRERGTFFRTFALMQNEHRYIAWAEKTLDLAQKDIPIPWWSNVRSFELGEEDFLGTTPRTAALKILGHFMQLGTEMVWKLVKKGRALLMSNTIDRLEFAYQRRKHDPAVCEFIDCPHLLSKDDCQARRASKKNQANQQSPK